MAKISQTTNPPSETAEQAVIRLTAELADAKATIASFAAEKQELDQIELMITEKMRVGLTRGQAMSVLAQQEAFDKYLADEAAKKQAATEAKAKESAKSEPK
jgi:hypothetical protein